MHTETCSKLMLVIIQNTNFGVICFYLKTTTWSLLNDETSLPTWYSNVVTTTLYWNQHTLREPGGAGSKILVCISLGRAEYTGRIISSGTSGPNDFIRSYRISHAVSISSWPVKNSKMSPVYKVLSVYYPGTVVLNHPLLQGWQPHFNLQVTVQVLERQNTLPHALHICTDTILWCTVVLG